MHGSYVGPGSAIPVDHAPYRFPPSWSVEETDACFIVRDHNGHALAYVYFEEGRGRRAAPTRFSDKPQLGKRGDVVIRQLLREAAEHDAFDAARRDRKL